MDASTKKIIHVPYKWRRRHPSQILENNKYHIGGEMVGLSVEGMGNSKNIIIFHGCLINIRHTWKVHLPGMILSRHDSNSCRLSRYAMNTYRCGYFWRHYIHIGTKPAQNTSLKGVGGQCSLQRGYHAPPRALKKHKKHV